MQVGRRPEECREVVALVPLVVLMLVMGFFPAPFLAKQEKAVERLLEVIETKAQATTASAAEAAPAVRVPVATVAR